MRVAGKGNLDQLSRLWQLQNSNLAAQLQQSSKVDRYKQVAMSKDELEKTWRAGHQEKRRRSRRNAQDRPTASLANHKQEKARTGALTDGDSVQNTQNTTSNPFADLAAIGNALRSGNLTGAQNAFATLIQDLQTRIGTLDNSTEAIGTTINATA